MYVAKQTCLDGYAKSVKSQHCSEARATAITERVVNMIALDLKPIRMVEGKDFINLLHYLEPGYKIPSRKHVTIMIQRQHKSVKEKLQYCSNATSHMLEIFKPGARRPQAGARLVF